MSYLAHRRKAFQGGSTLRTDLVAWWALEEDTTADRVDSHTNGYDLTASGSISNATGVIGNGADFEAADSRFLSRTDATMANWVKGGTSPITVNFWFTPETRNGGATAVSQGTEIIIDVQSTGFRFILNSFNGGTDRIQSASNTVQLGVTAMWTFVYSSGGDMEIWKNGTSLVTGTPAGSWVDDTNDFKLGAGTPGYLDGVLDEVGLWNRDLTSDEISELYGPGGAGIGYADTAP